MQFLPLMLAAWLLAGCGLGPARLQDFRQPPLSAYAICDGKPVPIGCEGRGR